MTSALSYLNLPACADVLNIPAFTHYTCIPSVVIILVLALLERRRFLPSVWGGRPALIIPLPLLDGYDNRFSFAAAFGAITTTIVSLFFNLGNIFPFPIPLWARALVIQIQVLEACVTCFPIFACIATRHKMVGAVLGALYSTVLLGAILTDSVQTYCKVPPAWAGLRALSILDFIPVILCYIYIILKSVHTAIVCVRTHTFTIKNANRRVYPHQQLYTKIVLSKHYEPSVEDSISGKLLYKRLPGFKYPVRVIAVVFILITLVYRLMISFLLGGVQLTHGLSSNMSVFNVTWSIDDSTLYVFTPAAFRLLSGVYFIVIIIATALVYFYIYLLLKSYRRHVLRMFRGNKQFILDRLPNPHVMMTNSLRFPGYQVAYMLWGFLILILTLMTFGLSVTYVLYFLAVNDIMLSAFLSILQTLSFPLMALLVFYLQTVLAKKVLMQNKLKPSDPHPPLNVDNRRFYEIFNYYSLFGSLAIGIFSCFWRILQGTILGIFLVGRLDHSIYSRGWEHRDKGYLSYISMLHVENSHNHPILRVFCDLLLSSIETSKVTCAELGEVDFSQDIRHSMSVNSRASRRWHLAYTLHNNPRLQHLRKQRLAEGERRCHFTRKLQNDIPDTVDTCPDDRVVSIVAGKYLVNNSSDRRDTDA